MRALSNNCRGEAGLGLRHRVGRALFNPNSPGHASVGRRSGLEPPGGSAGVQHEWLDHTP
jgi:hypothetical protein